jgi:RNA polymerase sigma factor (sigma-70 family)
MELSAAMMRWADTVAGQVARRLPPSFELDDLKQVARMETWRQMQKFDPAFGSSFSCFAYAAVKGAVLMSVRRRAYRDATHLELDLKQHERGRPDQTEQRLQYLEVRRHLALAIDALNERQRFVIFQFFFKGLDNLTIAEQLECSVSWVKEIKLDAYEVLRRELRSRGVSLPDVDWQ